MYSEGFYLKVMDIMERSLALHLTDRMTLTLFFFLPTLLL